MTRNSRRPVRRLTESQLRNIIRQEVRRLNEAGPGEPMAKLTIHRKQVAAAYGVYVDDPTDLEAKAEAQTVFNDALVTMKELASEVGLRGSTLGIPGKPKMFILIGPRSKVEEFAMALDTEMFAGPQSLDDESSVASQIVDLG